jgi:hypothetical protein
MNDWTNTPPPTPQENFATNAPAARIIPAGIEKVEGGVCQGAGFVEPDNTGVIQQNGRFVAGVSGNPRGRPKGARNRLTNSFMDLLANDVALHGASVLAALRAANPAEYVRLVISVLPKSLIMDWERKFDIDADNMTQEQLVQLLDQIQREKFIQKTLESVAG